MIREKRTFRLLFAILAVILMILPFVAAFNSFLSDLVERIELYRLIQERLVPWEAKLIAVTVRPFGIKAMVVPGPEPTALFLIKEKAADIPVELSWNCLGWQSFILLLISLVTGLQRAFTWISRLECILIGFLGTFLLNIFRMTLITAGIYYANSFFAMVLHDYFAVLLTLLWLMFFWWFSYSFVIESKEVIVQEKASNV